MAIETLGDALQQINRLFAQGVIADLADAHLLERFLTQKDAGAFEILVARHGPMVLSVCRGILRDPRDAEDAFQATFLVLVKKGGTIRGRDTLAGWLYQVAHRVAIQANAAAARRRTHERQAGEMAAATSMSGPAAPDELLPVLHEEIARLPEKYRLAIVLCDLEGMTQAQAAAQLHWSERTLRYRLVEARSRLKRRLARRGFAPDGARMGAVFVREARAAVPPAWRDGAVRAAIDLVNPALASGAVSAVTGSLTREVLEIMFWQKMRYISVAVLCSGLMAWAASATVLSRVDEHTKVAPTSEAPRVVQPPALQPDPLDAVGTFLVRGRVLDPDGKPVENAEIFVRHHTEFGWSPISPVFNGQKGRVAVSAADGQFQFVLDKASSDWPYGNEPPWHKATIAAAAPGFGPAWIDAGTLANGGDATLRLVRDDLPIRGRVLDTQGRPLPGVTVRLGRIRTVKEGVDLDAMFADGEVDEGRISASYGNDDAAWPGGRNTWTSDVDGRFEIRGVGRGRLGLVHFHGPAVADGSLYVMTRKAPKLPDLIRRSIRTRGSVNSDIAQTSSLGEPLVAARFEYVAGPTKPIHGLVRSKRTGKPVAGVIVHGYESATRNSVSTITDAEGRFQLVGLPKGAKYGVYAWARSGIDPFLGCRISLSDTEGLKPIETVLELPRGVIVIGRLVDGATGQIVPAGQCQFTKLPTNPNEDGDRQVGKRGRLSLTNPTFRLTVPAGESMFYAAPRGQESQYTVARLRKADKGKGVGGIGDSEAIQVVLDAFNTYKIVDVPDTGDPFAIELMLTRGLSRRGRVVGPDGKPVLGALCYGLVATWGEDSRKLADDTFEVLGLEPGHPRQLIFAHPASRLVGSAIVKGEEGKNDGLLEVRLAYAGSIKGRLVDEDGVPLEGASLRFRTRFPDANDPGPPRESLWPGSVTEISGDGGRFQLDGLWPGLKTSIYVQSPTQPGSRLDTGGVFREISIQPGEVRDVGDVKVKSEPNNS